MKNKSMIVLAVAAGFMVTQNSARGITQNNTTGLSQNMNSNVTQNNNVATTPTTFTTTGTNTGISGYQAASPAVPNTLDQTANRAALPGNPARVDPNAYNATGVATPSTAFSPNNGSNNISTTTGTTAAPISSATNTDMRVMPPMSPAPGSTVVPGNMTSPPAATNTGSFSIQR